MGSFPVLSFLSFIRLPDLFLILHSSLDSGLIQVFHLVQDVLPVLGFSLVSGFLAVHWSHPSCFLAIL